MATLRQVLPITLGAGAFALALGLVLVYGSHIGNEPGVVRAQGVPGGEPTATPPVDDADGTPTPVATVVPTIVPTIVPTLVATLVPTATPPVVIEPTATPVPATSVPSGGPPVDDVPPHVFVGVAFVNGAMVSAGTVITAWDGDSLVGQTQAADGGSFTLFVSRSAGLISFKIGDLVAAQTVSEWTSGKVVPRYTLAADTEAQAGVTPMPSTTPAALPLGVVTPTVEPLVVPTPTLPPHLRGWRPNPVLHLDKLSVLLGEPVTVTISIINSPQLPALRVLLSLEAPSGMTLYGDDLGDQECDGQCSVVVDVPAGGSAQFKLKAEASKVGIYQLSSLVDWSFPDAGPGALPEPVQLSVESKRLKVDPFPTPTPPPADSAESQRPRVHIAASRSTVPAGDDFRVTVDLNNPPFTERKMQAQFYLKLPSGWSLYGSDFAGSCAATCTSSVELLPGGSRTLVLNLRSDQLGSSVFDVKVDWKLEAAEGEETYAEVATESLSVEVIPPRSRPSALGASGGPVSGDGPPVPAGSGPVQPAAPSGNTGGGACAAPLPGGSAPVGLWFPVGIVALGLLAFRRVW